MKTFLSLSATVLLAGHICAQTPVGPAKKAEQVTAAPATKMEAFQPSAGSVVTFGYDELGSVRGIDVDVREIKDSKGAAVRGLLVKVSQGEYKNESSFVDADEVKELIRGFDALLEVSANPTQFKSFEVRYKTKGGLELTAFNDSRGHIQYAVGAGRYTTAQNLGLTADQMRDLKGKFVAAQSKLSSLQGS